MTVVEKSPYQVAGQPRGNVALAVRSDVEHLDTRTTTDLLERLEQLALPVSRLARHDGYAPVNRRTVRGTAKPSVHPVQELPQLPGGSRPTRCGASGVSQTEERIWS